MDILRKQTNEISQKKGGGHFSSRFHGRMYDVRHTCCLLLVGIQFELNSVGMKCICIVLCDWHNDIDFINRISFETNQISAPDQIVWLGPKSSSKRDGKKIVFHILLWITLIFPWHHNMWRMCDVRCMRSATPVHE